MRRVRHTSEQRSEILERVKGGERSVGEIAQEEGISIKTIHNWIQAKKKASCYVDPLKNPSPLVSNRSYWTE